MKKFFKALALVLALTLVIGVMPASAADDVKVSKTKTLYVGGTQGSKLDADGNVVMSKYAAKVAVLKLTNIAKADKADHEISAVIEDETVAHLSPKGNYIVADAIGTTNVTVTVDGVDYAVVLTVKKSASAETLTITGLEKDAEYVVGQVVDVTLPRAGKDTDVRALSVKGADGVELAVAGEKARTWTVTFPAVGAYTVAYCAFQSEKFNNPTAADTFDVTAKMPEVVSTRQISDKAFEVKFASKVEGYVSTVGDVFYEVNEIPVTLGVVKSVVAKDDVVTVTMYNSFAGNTTYKCEVAGQCAEFTAKTFTNEDIAKVVIAVENPIAQTDATVSYKLFTADDIDITNVATVTAVPTISTTSEYAWMTAADKVYFYEVGKTATITASISLGWEETADGVYSEKKISATPIDVTSIAATAAVVAKKQYSFNGTATDEKHSLRLGVAGALDVKYTYSDDSTKTLATYGASKIEIADETIAMVTGGIGRFTLKGIQTGSTTVIAYKANDDGSYSVIDAFPITITEANKAATAEISLDGYYLNTEAAVADEVELKVAVKDLDGQAWAGYTVDVKQVDNNAAATGLTFANVTAATDLTSLKINAGSLTGAVSTTAAQRVTFAVTVKVGTTVLKTQTFTVNVMDCTSKAADGYKLAASKTTLDLAAVYDKDGDITTATSSDVQLTKTYGQFNKGVVPFTTIAQSAGIPTTGAADSTVTYVAYSIPEDATLGVAADKITVKNIEDGAAAAKVGTYSFIAYECKYANTAEGKLVSKVGRGTAVITVVDTTVAPTVTVINATKANALTTAAYSVDWAGVTNNDEKGWTNVTITAYDAETDAQTGNIFVKKITVALAADDYTAGTITKDLTVNKLFK